jgi:hypothetical protein
LQDLPKISRRTINHSGTHIIFIMRTDKSSKATCTILWALLLMLNIGLAAGFQVSNRDNAVFLTPRTARPTTAGLVLKNENTDGFTDLIESSSSRRTMLRAMGCIPLTGLFVSPAVAKGIQPDTAFANLVKAREELFTAYKTFIPSRDSEGLRAYLTDEAPNMNNYAMNAQALLESKRLDAESKKEIGTIRRYGVGADVIIMYGGLKTEVDEERPNFSEIQKYLKMTVNSLDEVIAICMSNGFE